MSEDTGFCTATVELRQNAHGLKGRGRGQTQELYREVCAVLFFRYGITPTANKLYQLVRKGSMSVPGEALTKFRGDLREKSRTRIEHPELADERSRSAESLRAAGEHQKELNLLQQSLGDSRQRNGQVVGALQAVTASLDRAGLEAQQMHSQLNEPNAQAMLFRTQAEDLRRQWEETQQRLKEVQSTKEPQQRRRRDSKPS